MNQSDIAFFFRGKSLKKSTPLYKDLDETVPEIRLLKLAKHVWGRIYGNLISVPLRDAPKYIAISYTWGNADDKKHYIVIDEQRFEVRRNLFVMLQKLRRLTDEHTYFWIDAICINQSDPSEQSQQVALMRHVYANASMVYAWLGEGSRTAGKALRWIRAMYDQQDKDDWIDEQFRSPRTGELLSAVADILQRPYWSRMWIVQEIVCGSKVMLLCGQEAVQAEALHYVQTQHSDRLVDGVNVWTTWALDRPDMNRFLSNHGLRPISATKQLYDQGELRIIHALQHHVSKTCTDPKDMIYALAGLQTQTESELTINYRLSVAEVFTQFFEHEVKTTKKLEVLTFASAASRMRPDPLAAPSYVPDWTFHRSWSPPLNDIKDPDTMFTASSSLEAVVSFKEDGILTTRCMVIGQVLAMGRPANLSGPFDLNTAVTAFCEWSEELFDHSSTQDWLKAEGIARTLLAHQVDVNNPEDYGEDVTESDFLRAVLGGWAAQVEQLCSQHTMHPLLIACLNFKNSQFGQGEESDGEWAGWVQACVVNLLRRRLFVMANGDYGLAPDAAQVGDIVAIPFGCPLPMIFRAVGDKFFVIGEAYVDGWMYGKAVQEMEHGMLETTDLDLGTYSGKE